MEHLIESTVKAYDGGRITRRELVRALAALPAAVGLADASVSAAQSTAPFKSASINHVTFSVGDLAKGTEFYSKLLDARYMHQIGGNNYLAMGGSRSFICLTQPREGTPTRIDHFSVGVEDFDADKAMERLKKEGLETRTNQKGEVYFVDPWGLRVQLSSATYDGNGRG